MTTVTQDRQFIEDVVSPHLLEEAIEWISTNMSPEDVFSRTDLEQWAEVVGSIYE